MIESWGSIFRHLATLNDLDLPRTAHQRLGRKSESREGNLLYLMLAVKV